jgi:ABC-2 type transport system permease protein
MLPLYFICGVFVVVTALPSWLVKVANVFPVRHLADALLVAHNPHASGSGFAAGDLLVLALWAVAGLLVAIRRFSWLPRAHQPTR